jgi:hypothetical protein
VGREEAVFAQNNSSVNSTMHVGAVGTGYCVLGLEWLIYVKQALEHLFSSTIAYKKSE